MSWWTESDKAKETPNNSLPRGREEPKDTHCMVEPVSEDEATYTLLNTRGSHVNPLMVLLKLNQKAAKMELNTGPSASIISEATF